MRINVKPYEALLALAAFCACAAGWGISIWGRECLGAALVVSGAIGTSAVIGASPRVSRQNKWLVVLPMSTLALAYAQTVVRCLMAWR